MQSKKVPIKSYKTHIKANKSHVICIKLPDYVKRKFIAVMPSAQ